MSYNDGKFYYPTVFFSYPPAVVCSFGKYYCSCISLSVTNKKIQGSTTGCPGILFVVCSGGNHLALSCSIAYLYPAFLLSNFAVWIGTTNAIYANNINRFLLCYKQASPFTKRTGCYMNQFAYLYYCLQSIDLPQ